MSKDVLIVLALLVLAAGVHAWQPNVIPDRIDGLCDRILCDRMETKVSLLGERLDDRFSRIGGRIEAAGQRISQRIERVDQRLNERLSRLERFCERQN
jgi:hypothetical protein